MEFKYGLWTGISAIFGEDGRQLGEGNTRPLVFNHHVPAEVHACKYKGTRYNKLINISALRVAMNHFYETSAITVAVRDYYMSRINKPPTERPGIWDLFVISRASLGLIGYRYRRGLVPVDAVLPNDLSSQYKLVTGVFVICREMTLAAYPGVTRNQPLSTQELYDYADAEYLFRSDNGMVCAGSTRKIMEFIDFANLGRSHPESAKLNLDGEDDHLSLLRSFVSDLDDWYRYTLLTIELDYYTEIEILRRKLAGDPEDKAQLQQVLELRTAQYAYWIELLGELDDYSTESFEAGVLDRQNAILALLNRPSIDGIPEKVLNARLVSSV